ncbi:hypothetical protein Tco_1054735 [Tanacetum coccineum]|uniref:Uncharacterized protein n=1 Tax=Tanacetum coccineum TaxID=301880 RepID=A0ABQ5H008_9ASTR
MMNRNDLDIDSCCVALKIGRVVECERRSPQKPPRAIKCYAIVEAIDFDTGFASFVLGDNPILSLMSPISSLPPLMVCGVGGRLVASLSVYLWGFVESSCGDDVIDGDDDGCTCSH